MTVYYEVAILDSVGTTLFISIVASRFLKTSIKKWRLLLVCFLSGLLTIFYPMLNLDWYFLAALKLAIGVGLSAILFYRNKPLLSGCAAFFIATFLFGGAIFAVGLVRFKNVEDALTKPFLSVPLGIIIGTCIVLFFIMKKIILSFHRKFNDDELCYPVKITFMGKTIRTKGFLDTGNRLFDTISGLPIVIVSLKQALKIFDNESITKMVLHRGDKIKGCRYVSIGTITSQNKILVFKPSEFKVFFRDKVHIINDVMLGISPAGIENALGADVILHPAIF